MPKMCFPLGLQLKLQPNQFLNCLITCDLMGWQKGTQENDWQCRSTEQQCCIQFKDIQVYNCNFLYEK